MVSAPPTWTDVIAFVRSLPDDCPDIESSMYVDRETADAAAEDCEFLAGIGATVPKVFSHGGDAVVLHWEERGYPARYLTIHKEGRPAFLTVGRKPLPTPPKTGVR